MIRLIIEIERGDRRPGMTIATRAEIEEDDLSERLCANRFAAIAYRLLKEMRKETQHEPGQARPVDPNLGTL